jgi:hypothetical protein
MNAANPAPVHRLGSRGAMADAAVKDSSASPNAVHRALRRRFRQRDRVARGLARTPGPNSSGNTRQNASRQRRGMSHLVQERHPGARSGRTQESGRKWAARAA